LRSDTIQLPKTTAAGRLKFESGIDAWLDANPFKHLIINLSAGMSHYTVLLTTIGCRKTKQFE